MGRYIEETISANERIVATAKLHWTMFVAPAVWFAVGFVCFGLTWLIAIPMFIDRLLAYWSTDMALTNKRVIAKTGFIRRLVVDISLGKVEGVTYRQGIFGRILGYGSVLVRGTGIGQVPVRFISNPGRFKSEVDAILHAD